MTSLSSAALTVPRRPLVGCRRQCRAGSAASSTTAATATWHPHSRRLDAAATPPGVLTTNCVSDEEEDCCQTRHSERCRRHSCCFIRPLTVGCCFSMFLSLLVWSTCSVVQVDGSGIQNSTNPAPVRLPDKLFSESTWLYGKWITCSSNSSDVDVGYVFPAETWSCYGIRVNNMPLRSCYSHSPGPHSKCQNEDGINDFGTICRRMLDQHNIRPKLKAALIVPDLQVSSADHNVLQRRMVLMPNGSSFSWQEYIGSSGSVKTLRCMLVD